MPNVFDILANRPAAKPAAKPINSPVAKSDSEEVSLIDPNDEKVVLIDPSNNGSTDRPIDKGGSSGNDGDTPKGSAPQGSFSQGKPTSPGAATQTVTPGQAVTAFNAKKEMTEAVKRMQQALIDFANNIQTGIGFDSKQSTPGRIDPNRDKAYQPFLDWMLNSSVKANTASTAGKQFTNPNESIPNPNRMQDAVALRKTDKLREFVASINLLGKHKQGKEGEPDGIWDENTENAIRNAYSICYGIMDLFKRLDLDPNAADWGYQKYDTVKDLSVFSKYTPDKFEKENLKLSRSNDKTSLHQVAKNAKELAEYIERVNRFYETFRNKVLMSYGEHGPQTSGEQPFSTNYGATKEDSINEEKQSIGEYFTQFFSKDTVNDVATGKTISKAMKLMSVYNTNMQYQLAKIPTKFGAGDTAEEGGANVQIFLHDISSWNDFKNKIKESGFMYNNLPVVDNNGKVNRDGINTIIRKIRESFANK